MLSITSVCIRLCLVVTVVQSGLIIEAPLGDKESLKVPENENEITEAANEFHGTPPSELSDIDISNLIGNKEIDSFARAFVESMDVLCSQSEIIFLEFLLRIRPGYQSFDTYMGRKVRNANVIIKMLRNLYKSSEDNEEALKFTTKINAATKLKIKQALVHGLIKRLKPKPCLREFVAAFFEDTEIIELRFKGTTCEVSTIYNSRWYKRNWKAQWNNREKNKSGKKVCKAPTEMMMRRAKMMDMLFDP